VTGASSGIGRAIARRCAKAEMRIVAVARRMDRLDELAAELGPSCHPLRLDLGEPDAIKDAVGALQPPFDRIDVLVNCAGAALGDGRIQDVAWEQLRATIDTNVLGLVALTHAVLPQMVARRSGDIVNIGSIAGEYPYPTGHAYAASKAFVRQFTLNLRADLLGLGVRAMCIAPGTTETEFAAVRLGHDAARVASLYEGRRLLKPEDVADVVQFAIDMPRHVNMNIIEMMPTDQAFSFFSFAEREA
jgi:NADP-dependent 3-hydroxy acid dehydrogenase YdfG